MIYIVWIGESVREQRILTQLVAWSFAHGATLRTWGEDVDYYLLLEAERVFPSRGLLDFGFIHTEVTATKLLSLMNENSFEAFEAQLSSPKNFIYQISCLDASKVNREAGKIKSNGVLSSQRKNLSERQDGKQLIIRF